MLYIEKLVRHLREQDGEDIFFYLFMGFTAILLASILGMLIYGLITWLGIWIVAVPFALAALFLIVYAIGRGVAGLIEKYAPNL